MSCVFCENGCEFCRETGKYTGPKVFNKRQRRNLAAGRHPFGFKLSDRRVTCGGCLHANKQDGPRGSWQCHVFSPLGIQPGPKNIKAIWRGCEHWEKRNGEDGEQ